MSGFSISERAKSLLQTCGWFQGRCVSIEDQVGFLVANGIEPSKAATKFLAEFGGLRINLPYGGVTAANFDVVREMDYLEDEGDLPILESVVGQKVCPVGYGGRMLFFITPKEEMIFLHDEWVSYVKTESVFDGLELLFFPDFKCPIIVLKEDQKPEDFLD